MFDRFPTCLVIITPICWHCVHCLCGISAIAADDDALSRPYRSVREVVYCEVGGDKLTADVFRPNNDEKCPAVLMIHGGAWSAGDKWNMHDHARELAQEGFVAITVNYRLAPLHTITKQIDDCRAALNWLGKSSDEYGVDKDRIALFGYSAGAHLSLMIATRPESEAPRISAIVAGGAPCEFSNIPEDSRVLVMVMGGTRKELPKVYHDVSPLNFANRDCPPTLFFHGTTDFIVPPASSRKMFDALRASGAQAEYFEVKNKGHLTTFLDNSARRQSIEFLNAHLKAVP